MTLVAERPKRTPKRTDYIEFGDVLDVLLRKYKIRSQTNLSRLLTEGGHPVSQTMISYFMLGDYDIPARFVVRVVGILKARGASQEDIERLMMAWWESKPAEERDAIADIYRLTGSEAPEVTAEDLEDAADAEARREARLERESGEDGLPARD